MAILRCKGCGGNLVLQPDSTVAECDYCGLLQTVPSADDEKKLVLFERANRLRFGCEFDKAAGVYESIVADFRNEAEAYWGLLLCKYGIEYVDDPVTKKKIPTCHRSSFDSIFDDPNYEQAYENADVLARRVYRDEAKKIEVLRKGIIEVSSKEEPYDIFICYKETDPDGQRTLDSVLAQDIYDNLTAKGYRVFFARITLEDKLGQEYEPYIFAALNSAKVMLVIGTDFEYFNAVWVKNEWSRFLQLMARDRTKHLIPCYKGLDAYDIPKEFAKLQAQDLGKIGADQDLIRGIEKYIPKNQPVVAASAANTATVDSLLKRIELFLSDGDFGKADEYAEKVLDIDPMCVSAYIGKLMVGYRVTREADLGELSQRIDVNQYYKKIIQYGDTATVKRFEGYNKSVLNRIGQHNAKVQELEGKKQTVLAEVKNCDAVVNQCKQQCDRLNAAIQDKGRHLETLIQKVATTKAQYEKASKFSGPVGFPLWLTILIIGAELVLIGIPFIGFTGVFGGDLISAFVNMFVASTLLAISFYEKHSTGFGALMMEIIGFAFGILVLDMIVSVVVASFHHGGFFDVIGIVIDNFLFAIFGEHTDIMTDSIKITSRFISSNIAYAVILIVSIKKLCGKASDAKYKNRLLASMNAAQAEYDEKVNNDEELAQLYVQLKAAEGQYQGALESSRQRIGYFYQDYKDTAKKNKLPAEAIVPDLYR